MKSRQGLIEKPVPGFLLVILPQDPAQLHKAVKHSWYMLPSSDCVLSAINMVVSGRNVRAHLTFIVMSRDDKRRTAVGTGRQE